MPVLLSHPSSPTPSPAVLDFLAQLSPPLSPDSLPAPAFLCPSCEPGLSSARRRRRQPPSTSALDPAVVAVTPTEQLQPSQHPRHHRRSKTSDHDYYSLIAGVPLKYEQSSDGFWYLATSWSYHGKTSKPNLLSTPTPTPPPRPTISFSPNNVAETTRPLLPNSDDDDDDVNTSTDFNSTTPYSTNPADSAVTSDFDAIKDSLPTGWSTPVKRTKFYSIEAIIVVSLILAISLSLIIAGCVLGHKAKSGSHRLPVRKILNEAKARANAQKRLSRTSSYSHPGVDTEGGNPELEVLSDSERAEKVMKQVKRKEKLWDKWRSKNGKLSDLGLRRRKKKAAMLNNSSTERITTTTPSANAVASTSAISLPIVHDNQPSSTTMAASTASPALPVSSTSTLSQQSGSAPALARPPSMSGSLQTAPTSAATTEVSSVVPTGSTSQRQPPAYRHGAVGDHKMASTSTIPTYVDQTTVNRNGDQSLVEPDDVNFNPNQGPGTGQSLEEYPHPEYSPPLLSSNADLPHRAHVATDDKAVLEMMRKGASEPQDDAHTTTTTAITFSIAPHPQSEFVRPNAPVWVDESLENFKGLEDSPDEDSGAKLASRGQLQLPPLPSPDLHRRLERHYNVDVLLPPSSESSRRQEVDSIPQPSEPPLPESDPSSLLFFQPSAPPEDAEEDGSGSLDQLRPSAPPLLPDVERITEDEDGYDLANVLDDEDDCRDEQRRSRWNGEMDSEASLARARSIPSIAAAAAIPYFRPQRRRSLSISSLANDSSNPSKRLSLPRYEP